MEKIKKWKSLILSLIPLVDKFIKNHSSKYNPLHVFVVLLVWCSAIALIGVATHPQNAIKSAELIHWYSMILCLSGTLWIGAGVVYVVSFSEIRVLADFKEFQRHVIKTFSDASRHCIIGLMLVVFGTLLQVISETDYVIKSDATPDNYSCIIKLKINGYSEEAENITCEVSKPAQ